MATRAISTVVSPTQGRVLTGSKFYDPHKKFSLVYLITLDVDRKSRVLDHGMHLSNGPSISPGCRIFHFTDSVARTTYAYDYDVASGDAKHCWMLVKGPVTSGLPDALKVGTQGFIWSAELYGSCIARYDPDGNIECRIATPAKQTSGLTFGGPDLTNIVITSAGKSEPMPIMPTGYDPSSGCLGGALYHLNLGIVGKKEFFSEIRLDS